ncbi:hypothetical protein AAFF_G00283710 [Aldrovandia affinis]|uniref:Endonuclease/exonuclease/phosphatase domain-containing protein n=1 Tax=Aldrovandia affinis TaxID=143900 RepID=A0AAD7TA12_9TELE|nr:hypothetical protein AAFF_G00283710 [Aldrovandia affinis]
MDALLSTFPEDGTPVLLLGDFNLLLDTPQSSAFLPLLQSFDFTMAESPSTHKAGNQLDLVFTRSCTSPNITISPLHVSDCFLSFSLPLPSVPKPSSPAPTDLVCCNLHSLSPAALSATVLSSLPPTDAFSQLPAEEASSTLLSSLSSSFDSLCPLSTKPARLQSPIPWLTDSIQADRLKLRAAERKWRKSKSPVALTDFHTLLATFSSNLSSAKSAFFLSKIQSSVSNPRKLYSTFSCLLTPRPRPPPSSLTTDDFASFFREKVNDIRNSLPPSSPSPNSPSPISLPKPLTPLSSFSPLPDSDILQLVHSHRPTTCPLDPIPSPLFQSIALDILPFVSNVINSLSSGSVPSSLKCAHVVPLLKKPSLNPAVISNYQPVSLLPFLSKTLERAVYN